MAVDRKKLAIVHSMHEGEGGVVALYNSGADAAAAVETNAYFDSVADLLPGTGFILAQLADPELHLYGYTNVAGDVTLTAVIVAI